ncbi:ChaN family lipoprotein [Persephonella sp.]|uniref:ChaN family lipoprotein n=1 Tax=Persephonella sp. TaxID=2060922 RepID=UPI0025F8A907|nr:ChaN family lipoprotein [Persephonella sp.]
MRIIISFLLAFLSYIGLSYAQINYILDVSIDTKNSSLKAAATVKTDSPVNIKVYTNGLDVQAVLYGKKKLPVDRGIYSLKITPEKDLTIIYSAKFQDYNSQDIITDEAVSLLNNWYPFIDKLAFYRLRVDIDKGFVLVSEAENWKIENRDNRSVYSFEFPYPLEHIHLIGTKKWIVQEKEYNGIKVQTYFFERDKDLSEKFLDKTVQYIKEYEKRIGKFPYKRFAVVENFFPTGYSMPTFTLIGQRIIRFPFVINSSLPHEILHQWFGCSVYVDDQNGNWAEGLTTYLSDYYYSEDKKQYRKNTILKYLAYGKPDYPLKDFRGKTDKRSEAIGYGKTMMVFYMLEEIIGKERFTEFLSQLYTNYRFKRASWEDIKNIINRITDDDYLWFFEQWVNRAGMPQLDVSVEDHSLKDDGFHIKISVKQKKPYRLKLNVFVKTYIGIEKKTFWISKKEQTLELTTDDEPLEVYVDKDYQIFRDLQWEEINPVVYFTLADKNAVVYSQDNMVYVPISGYYRDGVLKNPDQFSYSDIYNKNVVILGGDNPVVKRIFGKNLPQKNSYVEVFKNPFGDRNVVTVFNLKSVMQAKMVIGRIKHYGKYSKIVFEGFRITDKKIKNYQNGIKLKVRQKAEIVSEDGIKKFVDMVNDALSHRVIYIGEQHTMFSNHAMQLNIIKALYEKYPKIAIGMEMFQRSKQNVIDRYLRGEIDEKTFLKESEYYKAWKYNYHLYRPIIQFCKEKGVPIIALNADRDIVRKVSQKGIESLSKEEIKKLPEDMDFVNFGYIEYLKDIFAEHGSSVTKKKKFSSFLQSQIIWDETMAQTASKYITKNPDRKLIILAGGGHIRYRYGIPSRVERRTGEKGLTILMDDQLKKGISDYMIYTAHLTGEKERKIGVYVEETGKGLKVDKVVKGSPAEKAGIKKGDTIIRFNGRQINDIIDLKIELFFSQGENEIVVKRNGKEIKMNIQLE